MAEEQVNKDDDDVDAGSGFKGLIAKIKSDKKFMIMVGGGLLLILLLIGGAAYYFLTGDTTSSTEVEELNKEESDTSEKEESDTSEKEGGAPDTIAKEELPYDRVYLYPLKSFFFPIKLKNKEESGHFLLVTPSFHMSNAGLGGQISKNLPSIRKRIYTILNKESYYNLTEKHNATKKRVKKKVIVKVNELLPVGTGVVSDIYFSEFIIK
jgi:flagellar basal body-associated protein FliL